MRKGTFPGHFYHVLNRGNEKQKIFRDFGDRRRFLLSLFLSHTKHTFDHIDRLSRELDVSSRRAFSDESVLPQVKKARLVHLVAFSLMDNHFHLLIEEKTKVGVTKLMQRLQNSYTKYFNTKYDRVGHLFQGAYKIVPVKSNEQLIYLSTYIHRNPCELSGWTGKEHLYPWSSCRDYLDGTDWQGLLENKIILDQLEGGLTYREVLHNSAAKEWSTSDVDQI